MLYANKKTLNDLIESRKKYIDSKILFKEKKKFTNGFNLSLPLVGASMLAVAAILPLDIYFKLKLLGCASVSFCALYILFVADESSNKATIDLTVKEMLKYSQLLADTTQFHEYLLNVFNSMLISIEKNPSGKNLVLERCHKLMEYNLEIMKQIKEVESFEKQILK